MIAQDGVLQHLRMAADTLGVSVGTQPLEQLMEYLSLLQRWNQVYNLTAVRDPQEMLNLHLVDSLTVVAPLRRHLGARVAAGSGAKLLDVGSGAGLPGVVLAICCPDVSVTCVDTVGKKAAFVQQVAMTLKLNNLRGLHARVETLAELNHDIVCSRAFSSLADFTRLSFRALAADGVWLAMKGKRPDDELLNLPVTVEVFHVEPLKVPGLQVERCIVWMRKKQGA